MFNQPAQWALVTTAAAAAALDRFAQHQAREGLAQLAGTLASHAERRVFGAAVVRGCSHSMPEN